MQGLPPSSELTRHVLEMCRDAGFSRVGVAGVEPSEYADELRAWLDAGKQGSMAWLGEHLHVRTDPGRLLRGSRAVVMVAMRYARRGSQDEAAEGGKVARYARGEDYHRVMKKRLHVICDRLRAEFAGHECRAFADIEPMPERELAARAGLGWVGKHTLVIHPQDGSWMTLGGFATTLPLVAPEDQAEAIDRCGTCTRCIDACPTGAISPYSVDASRCVSYLTIERRGEIAAEFHAGIGDWVFGCDVCQEVCPHNSARGGSVDAGVEEVGTRARLALMDVLGWTAEDRTAALSKSVIKRATLATLKRNAVIVLGNRLNGRGDAAVVERLREIAGDEGEVELVRGAARQVLERVGGGR